MATYTVKCADGTDPQCSGLVSAEIDIEGLTPDQVEAVSAGNSVCLTERQLVLNGIQLKGEVKEELLENGCVFVEADIYDDICGACGSDQNYDSEGNNITSI